MRKIYLLIGLCCLISFQALPQQGDVYASRKQTPDASSELETYPLKNGLKQLEKKFDVSIAYKDEWVEDKAIPKSDAEFETVEQALDELLRETNLYYEKAGAGYYVISLKTVRKAGGSQSASLLAVPALANDFASSAPTLVFEDKPLHVASLAVDVPAIIVTGRVTDENGGGFPGVNVLVKGTATGTSTDSDGRYSLSVPDENAILVFSFIGYTSQEINVGGRTTVDVAMSPDVKALEEVVVTALGIEKSTKGLGYATSKVNGDEVSINRTPNFMNTLQGKIAGVNITSLGTGPMGTSKIRIRGQSSISGQNNPLIVVNGVPIDNQSFGSNVYGAGTGQDGQQPNGGVSSDGGDAFASINPDDVESMTVLKGATAAALYGSRAKDGVIMITTKSKGTNKGIGVTYNMNFTSDHPIDYTDYQYVYGQGEHGVRPTTPNPNTGQWSFGERIQPGMTQTLFNTPNIPYEAQKGIINQFYRNGSTLTNSVAMSSTSDKGGLNLSVANMKAEGIVPNNNFTRNTINLGFGYDLSERLNVKGNINYSYEENVNPPNISNQDNTIPTTIMAMANTLPLSVLAANKYNAQGNEYVYSRFMNRTNPYWTMSEQFNHIHRDRIFGNLAAKYDLTKWLWVQARVGQDFWSRDQTFNNFPTGQASLAPAPAGFVNGSMTQESRKFREINADFLLNATKQFGDWGLNVQFGGNSRNVRTDIFNVFAQDFIIRGFYTVQNARAKTPTYTLTEKQINSLYGAAELNYKKYIYLNLTARNDWFSTLSPSKRSILYPSASLSYVFTESLGTKPTWLDMGKVRAAYAEVGSDLDVAPYSNLLYYNINGNPFNGQAVTNFGTQVPNPNLKPMRVQETEIGMELKMFNGRLGVDLAAYRKITNDQILPIQISDASGFQTTQINAGKSQNQGVEMMINVVPVRSNNLEWNVNFNASYNISKVLSLLTDKEGDNITVGSNTFVSSGSGINQQVVGMELSQITGFAYRRDASGNIVFAGNGVPLPSTSFVNYGSALPRWIGGITNSFNYKGVSLSFLIDFKLGGKLFSGTNFNAYREGLHKNTLEGREGNAIVGKGVNQAGQPNTVASDVEDYWASILRSQGIIEPVVYDAGYVKLRQISLGYDFTKFFKGTSAIKGLKVNLVANNVLMLKKWVDNIDPESFGSSSDNLSGNEAPGLPTTRSVGINLNVKF